MNARIEADQDNIGVAKIKVVGVGGGGSNAVSRMYRDRMAEVEYLTVNTDAQALVRSDVPVRLRIGDETARGLGVGGDPEKGQACAEESRDEVREVLEGADMVFIAAGMGGGTGTGAAPVIARAARERGILTVGVVTKPFQFEGIQRMRLAEAGLQELQQYVDTLIVIPNQNLFRVANEQTTFAAAFNLADEVLHAGVRGVTDLMVSPGLINLDFADIRTVMGEMGKAMMGTGEAQGENRAIEAAEAAINNPLLDNASIEGARGVLINVTGGSDVTLMEVDEAASRICQEVDDDANIIFGTSLSTDLDGQMRVAVIATGIEADLAREPVPEPSDKVHVLGISQRKGSDRPSTGAVGAADYEEPTAVVEEIEAPEQEAPTAITSETIDIETDTADSADRADGGLNIALNSVEQSFENTGAEAEPDAPAGVSEPVMIENSPPLRKMVAASSAGAIRAGVVMRRDRPEVVASDSDEPYTASQPGTAKVAASNPSAPMAKPDTGHIGFIPAPAVTPGQAAAAGLEKTADAFRVASMENAGGSGKKRGPSLFERMTGSGRARRETPEANPEDVETAPQRPTKPAAGNPAAESRGKEPAFETAPQSAKPAVDLQSIEEDPLEIPAFLRRQAN